MINKSITSPEIEHLEGEIRRLGERLYDVQKELRKYQEANTVQGRIKGNIRELSKLLTDEFEEVIPNLTSSNGSDFSLLTIIDTLASGIKNQHNPYTGTKIDDRTVTYYKIIKLILELVYQIPEANRDYYFDFIQEAN